MDEKPILMVAPPYDEATHRVGDEHKDTEYEGHIERVFELVALTSEEVQARQLAACHASRRAAYPPLGDQLDALARGMAALAADGASLPPQTLEWLAQIAAVKAAFPKPAPAPEPEPASVTA